MSGSMDGDRVRAAAEDAAARAWLRIVDEHSGIHDVVGPVDEVARMTATVSRCLEGGRTGARFPLLRLVSRRPALSGEECDALGREIVRLRALLGVIAAETAVEPPAGAPPAADVRTSDPALAAAAPLDAAARPPAPTTPAEPFPRWNGSGVPRTLADLFAWPLHVLEHVARLGATSRRGARLEVGYAASFADGSVAGALRDRLRSRTPSAPPA